MEEENKRQKPGPVDGAGQPEAADDFEAQPQLSALIEQMRAEQAVEPAPNFTLRVMAGITDVQEEMTEAADSAQQMRMRAASLMRYLTDTPSVSDIALCFMLAGFFYFLLGVIFFFGLKSMQPLPAMAAWLRLQPWVL